MKVQLLIPRNIPAVYPEPESHSWIYADGSCAAHQECAEAACSLTGYPSLSTAGNRASGRHATRWRPWPDVSVSHEPVRNGTDQHISLRFPRSL